MNRAFTVAAGAIGAVAACAGWRRYAARTTERVAYETLRSVGGVELRRYPAVVVAETVADSEAEAAGRLAEYLAGANSTETPIPRTAPVRTHAEPIELTAPNRTSTATDRVRMGVYLSRVFAPETAPEPTDSSVLLTVETPRTVAVRSVSTLPTVDQLGRVASGGWVGRLGHLVGLGRPRRPDEGACGDRRTDRARRRLLSAVADADLVAVGSPFLFEYPTPYLPAALERRELAIEVV